MNWIADIANGSNATMILGFIGCLVGIGLVMIKMGWLSLHGKVVHLGNESSDRKALKEMIFYTKNELEVYFGDLIERQKDNPDFSKERCLYSKELVYDVLIETFCLNNLTDDKIYIEGRIMAIWSILAKLPLSSFFKSAEYKKEAADEVEKIIRKAYEIKKHYEH